MTKRIRLFTLILSLIMVIGAMSPALASGGKKGSLTIHKLYFSNEIPEDLKDGDWKEGDLPEGTKPLDGVEFSIWKIGDNDELPSSQPEGEPIVRTTSNGGKAIFADLELGRYYVKETGLPKGVTQSSEPFIVDIPSTSVNGEELLYDVHVYPKNALVLGAAQLKKVTEEDGPLAGAKFNLYKKVEDGEDELIAEGLVTDTDGWTEIVGDLEVGDYYFVETEAPEGYGLDKTKQEFLIEVGNHAYKDGVVIPEKVKKLNMTNYQKPEDPVKEANEDSADIGETVRWTIKVQLPNNIKDFEMYKITDKIDEALNYAGNLSVKLDGNDLDATAYALTEPDNQGGGSLVLDFAPEKLAAGELEISFDTVINAKAVVGEGIPNKAELDYDNGFETEHRESNTPEVITGGADFKKVDGKSKDALKGAEFIVFKENDGKLYLVQDENGVNSWSSNKADATKFISGLNGEFSVNGLAYGEYFLEETKAPVVDGKAYKLLQKPVKFVVNADSHGGAILIENNEGSSLPKTGGMGTLLFTVVGLGLMGVAAKTYKREEK